MSGKTPKPATSKNSTTNNLSNFHHLEYFGLIFEFLFLLIGVYLYVFSRGLVRSKDPELQKKADVFRAQNGWWLRLLALGLVAIMAVNIILHLQQLVSGS